MIFKSLVQPATELKPDYVGTGSAIELPEHRRSGRKVWRISPDRYQLVATHGLVHFQDKSGIWREIDLTIQPKTQATLTALSAPYQIRIFRNRVGYELISDQIGRVQVELLTVGDKKPNRPKVSYEGNQLFWTDAIKDIDFKLLLAPQRVEIFKLLKTPTAPRKFIWRITEEKKTNLPRAGFRRRTFGVDDNGHALEIKTQVVGQGSSFHYQEEWTGRVGQVVNLKTRQKEWSNKVAYPVIIDAQVTENTTATTDDVREYATANIIYTSPYSSVNVNTIGRTPYIFHLGARFQTIGVPQGATINSATLKLKVNKANTGSPQFKIYADDVDNAAAWSNNSRPSQITKTTASVVWSPTASTVNSVGVTSLVSEIISRGGWSSSNNMRFGVLNQVTAGYNVAYVSDYKAGQSNAPILVIDYTTGGPSATGFMTTNTDYWGDA